MKIVTSLFFKTINKQVFCETFSCSILSDSQKTHKPDKTLKILPGSGFSKNVFQPCPPWLGSQSCVWCHIGLGS